jgi:O-methyltransferase involved in polyketide biosynthesis
MNTDYNKIIPTAWLVAYRRKFSDILFSKEIFNELDKLRAKNFFEITDNMLAAQLAPQYEARHKVISKLVVAENSGQILEIASGFTSRGLEMTENPRILYVEFDLQKVIIEKKNIIDAILKEKGMQKRKNLFFEAGNALDYSSLQDAVSHFKKKPITIVNEGLLRYMSFEEKTTITQNVYKLLKTYGGAWITSDITLKKLLDVEKELKTHNATISKMTGIDVDKNRFEDEEHARSFFENLGFSIERHTFMEAKDELASSKNLKMKEKDVTKIISDALVYVMRIKE